MFLYMFFLIESSVSRKSVIQTITSVDVIDLVSCNSISCKTYGSGLLPSSLIGWCCCSCSPGLSMLSDRTHTSGLFIAFLFVPNWIDCSTIGILGGIRGIALDMLYLLNNSFMGHSRLISSRLHIFTLLPSTTKHIDIISTCLLFDRRFRWHFIPLSWARLLIMAVISCISIWWSVCIAGVDRLMTLFRSYNVAYITCWLISCVWLQSSCLHFFWGLYYLRRFVLDIGPLTVFIGMTSIVRRLP